jgi:hypothetical protein
VADYHFELFDPTPNQDAGLLETSSMGNGEQPWFRFQKATAAPMLVEVEAFQAPETTESKPWLEPRAARIEPERFADPVAALVAQPDSLRVPAPESSILPLHRLRPMRMPSFGSLPSGAFRAPPFQPPPSAFEARARRGGATTAAAITRRQAPVAVEDHVSAGRGSRLLMTFVAVSAVIIAICVLAQSMR